MTWCDGAPGLRRRRISLATGVKLEVTLGGSDQAPPLLLLHGFPESARTWRHQLDRLSQVCRVAAPDQRGFAGSDKPAATSAYAIGRLVEDVYALADALGFETFMLAGHDWGGAVAWAAALQRPERLAGLIVANAPHPYAFQDRLWRDAAQRAASQYIRTYREPGAARAIREDLAGFLDAAVAPHAPSGLLTGKLRDAYLEEWGRPGAIEAMLKWYVASPLVVPPAGDAGVRPTWLDRPFPKTRLPVQVIWGRHDRALLPGLLDDLPAHVPDLRVAQVDAGHFVTWEQPGAVTAIMLSFLDERISAGAFAPRPA